MEDKKPTFEENMNQLDQIVNQLGQGNIPLEQALSQFQKGVQLSRELKATLQNAEQKLTQVVNDDGQEQPFDRDSGNDDETN